MSIDGGGFQPTAPAPVDYPFDPVDYPGYTKPPTSQAVLKPGVIPLRPLTLGDIFNASVNYIRVNPKATLGLTTVVVIVAELITLAINVTPLLSGGNLDLDSQEVDAAVLLGGSLSSLATLLTTLITSILLSGMLTVVIGRAVFGSHITAREAWRKLRGRILALIGLALLQLLVVFVVVGVCVVVVIAAYASTGFVGVVPLLAIPLGLVVGVALVYLSTMVSFAGPAVVLERLGVFAAIKRSFALVRRGFWRILGIKLLAQLVGYAVTLSVGVPFIIAGQIMTTDSQSVTWALVGFALLSIGNAISQIVVSPFLAGVTVFLYTDRRIRWEAFDLTLHSGAAGANPDDPDSTDHLWMVRRP